MEDCGVNELHKSLLVRSDQTAREAMTKIGEGSLGITLLVDEAGLFIATITDGDVRRAILRGVSIDGPVMDIVQVGRVFGPSVTATVDTSTEECLRIMQEAQIKHLPILSLDGLVVDLVTGADTQADEMEMVDAVIMAGGFGTRLRPLTVDTPKPMLQIDGQPLMERTVHNLRDAGIHNISVTTHYKPEKIVEHFGTGSRFGVSISYLAEETPLGTAGALAMVEDTNKPLLVLNGDILTMVDFRSLIKFHREQGADLTIGVRQYDVQVPYGVVQANEDRVTSLQEKPKLEFLVNAGVYLVEPKALAQIPTGERFDMTELINKLLDKGQTVVSFPIVEYWLDIGRLDDFNRAQEDVKKMRRAA